MHRLILLRHAKTEATAASGGDFERGLTERGRRDAGLMGRTLAEAGLSPDRVLVSAARRAQETWRMMADWFPVAAVEPRRDLYLAQAGAIAAVVEADQAEHAEGVLMVIGHNPGLHEYAVSLLGRRGGPSAAREALMDAFPTAAAAVFAYDEAGRPHLERRLCPRDVGGGVR